MTLTAFSSNATLYALYELTITLSYNSNGGTGTMSSSTNKRYYSSAGSYINPTFTLASNTFLRANYSFVRWRMGGTSGTAYNAGAQVTLTSNTTFYAEWQATSHTVTYIYNGTRATRTVSYGSSVLSPGITPTLSGCTFLGWTNNQSSASPLSSLNMGNSDITLWAVWKAANKNITPAKNNAWIEGGYLYVGTPIDTLAFNETVDTSLYSGVYINSLQLTLVNNLFYGGSGYAANIYVSDGTSYGLAYMQNNWTTTFSGTYNGIPYTRADSSNVVISGYSFTVNFTTNNNTSAKIYWRFQNITNDTAYRPQMITIVGTCYLVGRQFAR